MIDLSAAGSFTYIGGAGFSGTGGAEARAIVNGGGNTLLMLDVDGDGLRDGLIFMTGFAGLVEGDLIL